MTYDAENRLTAVGTVMTAGYSSGSQRAWKQNSTTKTYFIYDGRVPVSEIAPSGTIQATNTFGATGLVVRNTSLTNIFYTFDPQGNVVQRLYAGGGTWSTHMFSAFGTSTSTISTTTDPYSGFGGQAGYYTDWKTGLQLCRSPVCQEPDSRDPRKTNYYSWKDVLNLRFESSRAKKRLRLQRLLNEGLPTEWITVPQAATILGISTRSVYAKIISLLRSSLVPRRERGNAPLPNPSPRCSYLAGEGQMLEYNSLPLPDARTSRERGTGE